MLCVEQVAAHYGLRPDTVRRAIRAGRIGAIRVGRVYRLAWADVWAAEQGPAPRGPRAERYKAPLLCKKRIAAGIGVSTRTVERWIADGLPTRNVLGAVRLNPHDVADWLRQALAVELPDGWWR